MYDPAFPLRRLVKINSGGKNVKEFLAERNRPGVPGKSQDIRPGGSDHRTQSLPLVSIVIPIYN